MFLMGNVRAKNFEMAADFTNLAGNGSFGVLFRAPDWDNPAAKRYAANIDKLNGIAWAFIPKDAAVNKNVSSGKDFMPQMTCHFRLRMENGTASYYLDDQFMMERALGDYEGGYIGLVFYKTTPVSITCTSPSSTRRGRPFRPDPPLPFPHRPPRRGWSCMRTCTPQEKGGLSRFIKKKKARHEDDHRGGPFYSLQKTPGNAGGKKL